MELSNIFHTSLDVVPQTEAITQSSLKLVCAYLSEDWAARLSASYTFPELDALESRTQLPSFTDFGKRSGMDFDEDPKAKEVKVKKTIKKTAFFLYPVVKMKHLIAFFLRLLFFFQKPKMSVGQRKLAKASTAGMKPLSSFFAKKA